MRKANMLGCNCLYRKRKHSLFYWWIWVRRQKLSVKTQLRWLMGRFKKKLRDFDAFVNEHNFQ